ncbi:hypothetical protein HBI49_018820 [Parastagonospora nodorum]|nr:hypothetical protein HBI49_018820 [Parastagonospora nodorum]KAH5492888.1 hypothetical protein HBI31_116680 [Parastagonospora nodorum]KAH6440897.1 hypothetical protein HBI59_127140 [Parastagonospora nodorum]
MLGDELQASSSRKSVSSAHKPTSPKIETFELSEKEHPYIPVSTTKILGKFTRDPPPEHSNAELQKLRARVSQHSEIAEDVRKWAKNRESSTLFKVLLRAVFWNDVKVNMPAEQKLLNTIHHFFPPRADIKVVVCDFGDGRAQQQSVRLGDLEKEFREKPSWSTVRWIHAPIGVGLLHSSVEALFFHTGSKVMGRPFVKAGRASWPYLELEQFDLRSTRSIQDSRDILRILKSVPQVTSKIDAQVFDGDNNDNLVKDVTWRAQYVGKSVNFWDLAEADLPWQLSEGSQFNMNGPSEGVRTTKLEQVTQSLTRHPHFQEAYLARNPLRCFHRDDGFLLTMSPAAGVDYLNANMQHYLHTPPEELKEDNFASCVSHIYREFSETGTDTWRRKNAEWFLVYLVTELGTTLHNIRQGYSVPSLMDAYDAIVHELKERRYDRWQRNETINLVRAYLVCIDELTVLGEIFSKKLDFFRRLQKDCDHFEELDNDAGLPPDNDNGETTSERIGFAEHIMEESTATCKRLTADLRDSLNSLFQLRSIEQNELAIIADTQHKAIFVFTGFTIVFLPLSFFTSYFGMNLKGIIDTDKTQEYYWKVCGSVAFGIVLLVCIYAFRYRIRQSLSRYRSKQEGFAV